MSQRGVLRIVEGDQVGFWCPGCKQIHVISIGSGGWSWNADYDRPTFQPSILVTGVQRITNDERDRIMAGEVIPPRPMRCHSFVADGHIQFLCDCTHALAGQTVPLLMPVN